MSEEKAVMGSIGWVDLTIDDASGLRDFYKSVVGWTSGELDLGGYSDYTMHDANGTAVTGVCHARGQNAGLPAQWLIYVNIPDLDASLEAVKKHGGKVLGGPRGDGPRFAIIQDPAGAVMALYEPKS